MAQQRRPRAVRPHPPAELREPNRGGPTPQRPIHPTAAALSRELQQSYEDTLALLSPTEGPTPVAAVEAALSRVDAQERAMARGLADKLDQIYPRVAAQCADLACRLAEMHRLEAQTERMAERAQWAHTRALHQQTLAEIREGTRAFRRETIGYIRLFLVTTEVCTLAVSQQRERQARTNGLRAYVVEYRQAADHRARSHRFLRQALREVRDARLSLEREIGGFSQTLLESVRAVAEGEWSATYAWSSWLDHTEQGMGHTAVEAERLGGLLSELDSAERKLLGTMTGAFGPAQALALILEADTAPDRAAVGYAARALLEKVQAVDGRASPTGPPPWSGPLTEALLQLEALSAAETPDRLWSGDRPGSQAAVRHARPAPGAQPTEPDMFRFWVTMADSLSTNAESLIGASIQAHTGAAKALQPAHWDWLETRFPGSALLQSAVKQWRRWRERKGG